MRKQLAEQEIDARSHDRGDGSAGERGYDHTYGARPLRRIIQNLIEDPLAEGLLNSRFQADATIRVEVEDDLLEAGARSSEAGGGS